MNVGGRLAIALVTMVLAGCAARARCGPRDRGPGSGAADAFVQATKPCAGLKTMTGALHLSGRAGAEKIRGTLHTGLEAPAAVRFERSRRLVSRSSSWPAVTIGPRCCCRAKTGSSLTHLSRRSSNG